MHSNIWASAASPAVWLTGRVAHVAGWRGAKGEAVWPVSCIWAAAASSLCPFSCGPNTWQPWCPHLSRHPLPPETLHLLKVSLSYVGPWSHPRDPGCQASQGMSFQLRTWSSFHPGRLSPDWLHLPRPSGQKLGQGPPQPEIQRKRKVRKEGAPSSAERK